VGPIVLAAKQRRDEIAAQEEKHGYAEAPGNRHQLRVTQEDEQRGKPAQSIQGRDVHAFSVSACHGYAPWAVWPAAGKEDAKVALV
jgi:hypothetical protein